MARAKARAIAPQIGFMILYIIEYRFNFFTSGFQAMETEARVLMPIWYCPRISREGAIDLVKPMDSGSFIMRSCTTVKGGYSLTLKLSAAIVRKWKEMCTGLYNTFNKM